MRIGPLRFFMQIQEEAKTKNATLGTTREWKFLRNVYASIEPIASTEYTNAAQQRAIATHRIVIRYFADLNVKHRFKHGDKQYEITGILQDRKTGQAYQTCEVKEVL